MKLDCLFSQFPPAIWIPEKRSKSLPEFSSLLTPPNMLNGRFLDTSKSLRVYAGFLDSTDYTV
jgi:hypothetical protein